MKQARYKRTNTVRFHFHEVPKVGKIKETESRWWEPGVGESVLHGDRVSVWED